MTDTPGEQLSEEPQSERGPMGSRDTGSDAPSGGPTDRPAGKTEPHDADADSAIDSSVSERGGPDLPAGDGGWGKEQRMSTESPSAFGGGSDPDATGATLPPYEDRRESADVDSSTEATKDDAKVAGATGPVEDPEMKGPEPADTERGATASPADEQPAGKMTQTEESDPGFGPAHVPGTPRGEDLSES